MGITLVCVKGPIADDAFDLGQGAYRLGRDESCDIVIEDDMVSREHLLIEVRNGTASVKDLGSRNGLSINNTLSSGGMIKPGDRLEVGQCVFEVQHFNDGAEDGWLSETGDISSRTSSSFDRSYPSRQYSVDDLRDPGERAAFIWLAVAATPIWIALVAFIVVTFGLGLLAIGFLTLLTYVAELFIVAYLKTNSIQVGERQLPEVYSAVLQCCQRLGIEPPIVYIVQHNIWNAFAAKVARRRFVVLFSGAVDSILLKGDMRQITYLVGHEIGHHAAGHFDFWSKMVCLGGWIPALYLWYQRRGELTCDNIGLYCSGSLESSLLALSNMTVGAQLANKVDINQAIQQWHEHRHELVVRYTTIYSTHPHHLWRMDEMRKAAASLEL